MERDDLIFSIIYIDRFIAASRNIAITQWNVHRIWFVAIALVYKYRHDNLWNNKYIREIGGLERLEFTQLEKDFLFRIGFTLFVKEDEYNRYVTEFNWQQINSSQIPISSLQPIPQGLSVDTPLPDSPEIGSVDQVSLGFSRKQ